MPIPIKHGIRVTREQLRDMLGAAGVAVGDDFKMAIRRSKEVQRLEIEWSAPVQPAGKKSAK